MAGKEPVTASVEDAGKFSGQDVQVWWGLMQSAPSQKFPHWVDQVGMLVGFVEENVHTFGVAAMAEFVGTFDEMWQGTLLEYVEPVDGFTEQVVRRWGSGGRWAGVRTLAAGNPFLPQIVSDFFYNNADSWEVKQALATNVNVSATVMSRLCEDATRRWCGDLFSDRRGGLQIAEGLAGNPKVGEETLRELSRVFFDPEVETGGVFLLGLATNPHTPAEILEKLSIFGDRDVVRAVVSHPNIPSWRLDEMCAQAQYGEKIASTGQNLSVTACARLMEAENTRVALARNPYLSGNVAQQLSQCSQPGVLAALAWNRAVDDDVLLRLADSSCASVVAAVTRRPQVGGRVLLRVSENPFTDSHIRRIADHRLTLGKVQDAEFVAGLGGDESSLVAGWPGTPGSVLTNLAFNNRVYVTGKGPWENMELALRNPGCPVDTVRKITKQWRGEWGFPAAQRILWERINNDTHSPHS